MRTVTLCALCSAFCSLFSLFCVVLTTCLFCRSFVLRRARDMLFYRNSVRKTSKTCSWAHVMTLLAQFLLAPAAQVNAALRRQRRGYEVKIRMETGRALLDLIEKDNLRNHKGHLRHGVLRSLFYSQHRKSTAQRPPTISPCRRGCTQLL
jgi:hypothetical protein